MAQPAKKQKGTTTVWHMCFDMEKDKTYKCPFKPDTQIKSGKPHSEVLNPGSDNRVLEKHMQRWHTKVYSAITAALDKGKDFEIVISQLKKDHASSAPSTMHRFVKKLDERPDLVTKEIALCLWIAEAGLSFHCFELDSFKTFCQLVNFNPRSPDTWSQSVIPPMAHVVETQNILLLNQATYFAISLDGWSENGKISGAIAHFITPSLECHRQIFLAEEIRANSTNELLAASLSAVLLKQQLKAKLSVIVTDNGDNYAMGADNLAGVGSWRCCCHTLNLIVEEVLKGIIYTRSFLCFCSSFFLSSLFSFLSLCLCISLFAIFLSLSVSF